MLSKYPILGFEDGLPTRLILTGLSNLYGDNFVGSFHLKGLQCCGITLIMSSELTVAQLTPLSCTLVSPMLLLDNACT